MGYWIISIIVALIVLEEGLYFLSNRIAFRKPKGEAEDNPKEKFRSRLRKKIRIKPSFFSRKRG